MVNDLAERIENLANASIDQCNPTPTQVSELRSFEAGLIPEIFINTSAEDALVLTTNEKISLSHAQAISRIIESDGFGLIGYEKKLFEGWFKRSYGGVNLMLTSGLDQQLVNQFRDFQAKVQFANRMPSEVQREFFKDSNFYDLTQDANAFIAAHNDAAFNLFKGNRSLYEKYRERYDKFERNADRIREINLAIIELLPNTPEVAVLLDEIFKYTIRMDLSIASPMKLISSIQSLGLDGLDVVELQNLADQYRSITR